MIANKNQDGDDPRCAALLCEAVDFIKTQILRLQIAYKIEDAKSLVRAERHGFQSHFPLEQRPTSYRGYQDLTWHKLRMDPLFVKEDEVVGLDLPRATLKNWLTKGKEGRTVISVVGIGGVGKTTLAKQVFDQVHNDFECHAWITVSKSYTVEELLRNMLEKLCKEKKEDPPRNVSTMDRSSLIEEVRHHLCNKRYVVLFDDVWNEKIWDHIESVVIDDKNGSRVLITTRDEKVAEFCKKSSLVEVFKLKEPLSEEESLTLFCKKAFQYSSGGRCPEELKDVSSEIVRKCKGLPLAIVAVSGLLSQKDESAPEWRLFNKDLSLELERNSDLDSIRKNLDLSYDDLSINLRSCLLYFGMYPEDYEIKSDRLIRHWIAEGFVQHEEAAQQYLSGLIQGSLVQVSSLRFDGKVNRCRVHDLIHDMILRKVKEIGFCEYIDGHDQSVSSRIVRRLTIATNSNDVIGSAEKSHIRSILVFTKEALSEHFTSGILAECMPLKIIDFENVQFSHVPENLGNLIRLKYLSFKNTRIKSLPKSIGKLQYLESLDVRQTDVSELPKEISKLQKLRHLLADDISSFAVKDCLGSMASLEKIRVLRIDNDGVVIKELGKLKQLRELRISNFKEEQSNTLSSSIDDMQFLETLHIYAADEYNPEVIDLHFMSSLSTLTKLSLIGKLKMLPNWIPRLENLVKLSLKSSNLTNDPLKSIQDMPNLLFLYIGFSAHIGESLHFQQGGFQKLKQLDFECLFSLNSIIIDKGALHSLKKFQLTCIPELKTLPSGIQHLEKFEVLDFQFMSDEFEQNIDPNRGQEHWMIQHVPHVSIGPSGTNLTAILHKRIVERRKGIDGRIKGTGVHRDNTIYTQTLESSSRLPADRLFPNHLKLLTSPSEALSAVNSDSDHVLTLMEYMASLSLRPSS